MKVVTLIGDDFVQKCEKLACLVLQDFKPDVVVGVATGGKYVVEADSSFTSFNQLIVKRQRPGTKKKQSLKLINLLKYLPVFSLDFLRVIEVYYQENKFKHNEIKRCASDVTLISGDIDCLSKKGCKVLVVDDAVDSGNTMLDVLDYITSINDSCNVKSAVLTTTFSNPIHNADFTLYSKLLIRCPWAMDVK
ncbi:MAG: hypoxanthine phosphoribosyltransferase [Alteromonadaceae bacterium]|jgi:hypoxanthine phosphoribosyltransferase